MSHRKTQFVFYIIIIAQFFGTSLWFAGNAILPQLQQQFHWPSSALGYITSSTQLGFIVGTLVFSVLGLADRFSPSKIFFWSSLAGSCVNLVALVDPSSYPLVIMSRCLVGFFLAGIYPVGMKIAADWKKEGLGNWLGALVGALVLGTAFPHGMKLLPGFIEPTILLISISLLSVLGGTMVLFGVGDGPYRKGRAAFSFSSLGQFFKIPAFRSPAFGYFGHMWELYAFWTFVPWIVITYHQTHPVDVSPSLLSFLIIGSGSIGCVLGGKWSSKIGSEKVAAYALISSGICCLLSPVLWFLPTWMFMTFMIVWGLTVVADSPQFSTLIARNAPEEFRGSAITLSTCIGFSITIVSIQLLNYGQEWIPKEYLFLLLLPGPVFGLVSMKKANA